VGDTLTPLYEKSFYCTDLGTELAPIIKAYFASEEHKTGIPSEKSVLKQLPFEINVKSEVTDPVILEERLREITENESLFKVEEGGQFEIDVHTEGSYVNSGEPCEHWIWQIEGTSMLGVGEKSYDLGPGDSILIPLDEIYIWEKLIGCKALLFKQYKKKHYTVYDLVTNVAKSVGVKIEGKEKIN